MLLQDLHNFFKRIREDSDGLEIARITFHPKDLDDVVSAAGLAFVHTSPGVAQLPCKGTLWGAHIYDDPRNEPGKAYVVSKRLDGGGRGHVYPLIVTPAPPKPTSWERVLQDDFLGAF